MEMTFKEKNDMVYGVDVHHIINPQNYDYEWADDGNTRFRFIWSENRIHMVKSHELVLTIFYNKWDQEIKRVNFDGTSITTYNYSKDCYMHMAIQSTTAKDYSLPAGTLYRTDIYDDAIREICTYDINGRLEHYRNLEPDNTVAHSIDYRYQRTTGREICYVHRDKFFHTWAHSWIYGDEYDNGDMNISCNVAIRDAAPRNIYVLFSPEGKVLKNVRLEDPEEWHTERRES